LRPGARNEGAGDAFVLFDFERRPLIDEGTLKERYLRLAANCHPDAPGGHDGDFYFLQEAYKVLREPATRLRHLIELEFPDHVPGNGHAPHAELFLRAGSAVQVARGVSQRFEKANSALARALLSPEIAEALRQIREASEAVRKADDELADELRALDARWPDVSPEELAALASSFKFLARWQAQLSEWEFRLSTG
jgi:curved DNA-binding protein CbpA